VRCGWIGLDEPGVRPERRGGGMGGSCGWLELVRRAAARLLATMALASESTVRVGVGVDARGEDIRWTSGIEVCRGQDSGVISGGRLGL
jgi:hypothetical protein